MHQPQPWFRTSKNAWYVEHRGAQRMLGKHTGDTPPKRGKTGWNPPDEIRESYRKLMAADPVAAVPASAVVLVKQVCDLYLEHICPFAGERPSRPAERRKREKETGVKEPDPLLKPNPPCEVRTFWWYDAYLQDFCECAGNLKASELKPIHVTRWLDAHPEWKTGRRCAITAVKRAFNWAADDCRRGHCRGLVEVGRVRVSVCPDLPRLSLPERREGLQDHSRRYVRGDPAHRMVP